jgi:hypothetical protein
VYVYQGLTVGWWKEERHSSDTTVKSAGFKSQAGWASHGCCVLLYSCCVVQKKEKGEERVGVGGRGKYPGAPPHHIRKKEKNKPTVKRYLIGQVAKRGKAIKNNNNNNNIIYCVNLITYVFVFGAFCIRRLRFGLQSVDSTSFTGIAERKQQRDLVHPDLNLEAGRTMGLVLFDMIQPDWLHSSEKAAIEFLKRLKIAEK